MIRRVQPTLIPYRTVIGKTQALAAYYFDYQTNVQLMNKSVRKFSIESIMCVTEIYNTAGGPIVIPFDREVLGTFNMSSVVDSPQNIFTFTGLPAANSAQVLFKEGQMFYDPETFYSVKASGNIIFAVFIRIMPPHVVTAGTGVFTPSVLSGWTANISVIIDGKYSYSD